MRVAMRLAQCLSESRVKREKNQHESHHSGEKKHHSPPESSTWLRLLPVSSEKPAETLFCGRQASGRSISHGYKENADVVAASRVGRSRADLRLGLDDSCGEEKSKSCAPPSTPRARGPTDLTRKSN